MMEKGVSKGWHKPYLVFIQTLAPSALSTLTIAKKPLFPISSKLLQLPSPVTFSVSTSFSTESQMSGLTAAVEAFLHYVLVRRLEYRDIEPLRFHIVTKAL